MLRERYHRRGKHDIQLDVPYCRCELSPFPQECATHIPMSHLKVVMLAEACVEHFGWECSMLRISSWPLHTATLDPASLRLKLGNTIIYLYDMSCIATVLVCIEHCLFHNRVQCQCKNQTNSPHHALDLSNNTQLLWCPNFEATCDKVEGHPFVPLHVNCVWCCRTSEKE